MPVVARYDPASSPSNSESPAKWYSRPLHHAQSNPTPLIGIALIGFLLLGFLYRRRVRASVGRVLASAGVTLQVLHIHVHHDSTAEYSQLPSSEELADHVTPPPYRASHLPAAQFATMKKPVIPIAPYSPLFTPSSSSAWSPTFSSGSSTPPLSECSSPTDSIGPSSPETPRFHAVESASTGKMFINTPRQNGVGLGIERRGSFSERHPNKPLPVPLDRIPRRAPNLNMVSIPLSPTVTISIHTSSPPAQFQYHSRRGSRSMSTIDSPTPDIVLTSVPRRPVQILGPQSPQSPPGTPPMSLLTVPARQSRKKRTVQRSMSNPGFRTHDQLPHVKEGWKPQLPSSTMPSRSTSPKPRDNGLPTAITPSSLRPTLRGNTSPASSPMTRSTSLPATHSLPAPPSRRSVPPPAQILPFELEAIYPDQYRAEESAEKASTPSSDKEQPESSRWGMGVFTSPKQNFFELQSPQEEPSPLTESENESEPETPLSAKMFFNRLVEKSKELKSSIASDSSASSPTSTPPLSRSSSSLSFSSAPREASTTGLFGFRNKLSEMAKKAVAAIEREMEGQDSEDEDELTLAEIQQRRQHQTRSQELRPHATPRRNPAVRSNNVFVIGGDDEE